MKDTYLTLEGPCEGLFKAKGSKHFGYGWPIHSEDEANLTQSLEKHHSAAGHMLGCSAMTARTSSPRRRGTEQQQGLGVIRSNELTMVLFAVVRYFGGTKLGVGGLIEAYREGAADALQNGNVIESVRTQRHEISFAYEHMGVVMGLLKRWELAPATTNFQISCSLEVDVRLAQVEAFVDAVEETRVATIKALTKVTIW